LPSQKIDPKLTSMPEGVATAAVEAANRAYDLRLRRYLGRLLGTAETEDALQEVYARLLHAGRNGEFSDFALPYILRTAENVARDILRRRRARRSQLHDVIDEELRSTEPSPFDNLRGREGLALLKEAIQTLPPLQRRVLLMHRLEDLPMSEVATELRLPLRTVQRHMHDGLIACKEKLERLGWFGE